MGSEAAQPSHETEHLEEPRCLLRFLVCGIGSPIAMKPKMNQGKNK